MAHQREIVNFHYRLVGNRMEAEDLAQETFLKAYKRYSDVREVAKRRSWLFAIARNVTMDFFRKNKNRPLSLDEAILGTYASSDTENIQTELERRALSRELHNCIATLAAEDQTIVRLLYYDGFSYKDIGELLNINQNTLKSRLHRARKSLLKTISANGMLADAVL